MAEHTTRERLQPSLLDRLTDDAPDQVRESRDQRVLSIERLRSVVLRDLGWLLNTVNLESVQSLGEYPRVAASVVNYGAPDMAGHTASSIDVEALERLMKQAIVRYEPRLMSRKLKVKLALHQTMRHNSLTFEISSELFARPMNLRMDLKTEVDLEIGHVDVAERSGRSSG
jgi:type VI secretion system protein ImpF